MRTEKVCSHCKIEKPLADFYSDKSRPDGRYSICVLCCRKRLNANYAADPTKFRQRQIRYYAKIIADPERHKEHLFQRKLRRCT